MMPLSPFTSWADQLSNLEAYDVDDSSVPVQPLEEALVELVLPPKLGMKGKPGLPSVLSMSTIAPSEASSRLPSPELTPRTKGFALADPKNPLSTLDLDMCASDIRRSVLGLRPVGSRASSRVSSPEQRSRRPSKNSPSRRPSLQTIDSSDEVAEVDLSKKFASKAPRRCLEIDTSYDEETEQDIAKQNYEMNNVYEDPPTVPWHLRPPKGKMCFPRDAGKHYFW